jgi:hypothetical protein
VPPSRTDANGYTVLGLDSNQIRRAPKFSRGGRSARSEFRGCRYALAGAGLVVAVLATSVALLGRGGVGGVSSDRSFGAGSGMHVVVRGNQRDGYYAQIYNGDTFVTGRGMVGQRDLTVLPGTSSSEPTGPDLLSEPVADLGWRGPVAALPRKGNQGRLRGGTAPDGQRGINWVQGRPAGRTWIYAQPAQELTAGKEYQVRVTLLGSGYVYLDFYNGQVDLTTVPVHLSRVPTTLTLDGVAQQGTRSALLQVSTASAGPVDLWVTSASVQAMKFRPVTRQDWLRDQYRMLRYDAATKTLTLAGSINVVGGVQVSRYETYRFVTPEVIAARIGVSVSRPAVLWFSPYTDFNRAWRPLWVGGYTKGYESPLRSAGNGLYDSPIPVLGAADGNVTYGVASYSTWDDPIPGYNSPHLLVQGDRLAAPLVGTQADPVTLTTGESESWGQVLFRGGPGTYGLALAGEMAMGAALGFTAHNSPGAGQGVGSELGVISRVTAYWDRETTTKGYKSLVPSNFYGPSSYMRDTFWTALGLEGTPFEAATEVRVMASFTSAVPTSGPNAGHVPDTTTGGFYPDESGLYYLIRTELDMDRLHLHLPPADVSVARLVLAYIDKRQVNEGAFMTAAPSDYGRGFVISPDSWLDGYLYPGGAVDAYDQGLYVVALEAARRLGLGVTAGQLDRADTVYRSLYDPRLGYLVWLSTTTYKSPDVLVGDALSLYLFDRPLLPTAEVVSTLRAQAGTPYGTMDIATRADGYLRADQFRTLQVSAHRKVVAVGEPAGWYQNGGSWFLWTYLCQYAALRSGDQAAAAAMASTANQELEVTPLTKEFQLTRENEAIGKVDPAYPYPLGSSGVARQGYGWDAAFAAFQASLGHAPAPLAPLGQG